MGDVYVHIREDEGLTHHAPQYVYEGDCPIHSTADARVVCQLTSNTNESMLWCNESNGGDCGGRQAWTQLRKSFQSQGTRFARVWQDIGIPNPSTGLIESDPRSFERHLREASLRAEERTGMAHDFQPTAPEPISDDGLQSQHDRAVADGRKDSRGRFIYQV